MYKLYVYITLGQVKKHIRIFCNACAERNFDPNYISAIHQQTINQNSLHDKPQTLYNVCKMRHTKDMRALPLPPPQTVLSGDIRRLLNHSFPGQRQIILALIKKTPC